MDEPNFVVVGSGAAGLSGAIAARLAGLRPIIIEKAAVWGGTTATSGVVLWVPGNHVMAREGAADDTAGARDYLMNLLGPDAGPRERAKVEAFLAHAPEVVRLLEAEGVRWIRNPRHPDYYPRVGGAGVGRTLESGVVDGRILGERLAAMRAANLDLPAMDTRVTGAMMRAKTGLRPLATAAGVMARQWRWQALGRKPFGSGRALVARLMHSAMRHGIPLLLETRLVELDVEAGAVKGVVVEDAAGRRTLPAPAGVLLAAGGFARNPALRRKYQGDLDGRWSNAIPEDEGDALAAATAIGADTELTDDCWWMPTIMVAPGEPSLVLAERTMPGSLIVDQTGRRYMNEAQSYMSAGAVNRRHGGAEHAHWLVFGQRYLDRYIFRRLSDPASRQRMREQGLLHSAQTLPELAAACGLDPAVFAATVERFDAMARAGRDEDFERGETIYDAYWGDPKGTKGTLGPIGKPPYYAARIFPGDLGTNGGLKTDEHARVLTAEGRPIEGLYAAGNGSGSPFGRTYPGAGGTIAPAATFGYIAARHAAQRSNAPPVRELAEA